MDISTSPKPTIYRNLYEYTGQISELLNSKAAGSAFPVTRDMNRMLGQCWAKVVDGDQSNIDPTVASCLVFRVYLFKDAQI